MLQLFTVTRGKYHQQPVCGLILLLMLLVLVSCREERRRMKKKTKPNVKNNEKCLCSAATIWVSGSGYIMELWKTANRGRRFPTLHKILDNLKTIFRNRFPWPHCLREQDRRSFLTAAIRLFNASTWVRPTLLKRTLSLLYATMYTCTPVPL